MTLQLFRLVPTLLCLTTLAWSAEEKAKELNFQTLKASRADFAEKFIQVDGQIKDLKIIKEDGNKIATFFLMDPKDQETSFTVRVNLIKKKTVINTFSCIDGEFVSVQGRFKPWGQASYLGKVEVREKFHFDCSETAEGITHAAEASSEHKNAGDSAKEISFSKPILLMIGNGGTSKVVDANGKLVSAPGAVLEPGSLIETGTRSAVQLKYPDGSKISVGSNSQIVTEKGEGGVQEVSFNFGRIHALITKQKSNEVHFKVKTRAATMGVRGTQFFIDAAPTGKAVTRVINGTVEVAKDNQALMAGKGQLVTQNEMVEVEDGKISSPKHFDAGAFLAKVKGEQADLVDFADSEGGASLAQETAKETTKETAKAEKEQPSVAKLAATSTPTSMSSGVEYNTNPWAKFRVGALGYLSKDQSSAFTGMISWNPEMNFVGNWNLGLDLGFAPRNTTIEYALVGTFKFSSSIAAEIKGGAQSFLASPKLSGGMGGLALNYSLGCECFLDSVIIGDDLLSLHGNTFNIVRIALGIKL